MNKLIKRLQIDDQLYSANNSSLQQVTDGVRCKIIKTTLGFNWCFPDDYDNEVEPFRNFRNGQSLFYYNFEFEVLGIQEVNDNKGTLKVQMYLTVKWQEPRIKIIPDSSVELTKDKKGDGYFPISLENLKLLWTPDLNIYDLDNYESAEVIGKPMSSLKMNETKFLSYSHLAVVNLYCELEFKYYPFDKHECLFRAGSYAYDNDTVSCTSILHNKTEMHGALKQRDLQYNINIKQMPTSITSYDYLHMSFSTCGFVIELKRGLIQMMIQVYVASILLVITAWLSFMVDPAAVPGRMAMLVTSFLALINIVAAVKMNSPKCDKMNAVDIFLVICVVIHFGALFEFIMVMIKYGKMENSKWNAIDKIAVIIFPIIFMTCLSVYFVYFYEKM